YSSMEGIISNKNDEKRDEQRCIYFFKNFKNDLSTFFVEYKNMRDYEVDEFEETLVFCIGSIGDKYTEIDKSVIDTKHRFLFSNDIRLTPKLFIASRNISILRKIDQIINKDFYIGGEWESKGGIPYETYISLVDSFPKSAELTNYVYSRISVCLKEFFPECDRYDTILNKYLSKPVFHRDVSKSYYKIEIAQFESALVILKEMLSNSLAYSEKDWQDRIQEILQLLYPQYLFCVREVRFKGIDGYDKQPDFIAVDTNGYVDIIEIKKPEIQILTKQASYRNNYVPVREFSGAIQQIEKYILCLTTVDKSREEVRNAVTTKIEAKLPIDFVNPKGILLIGRSADFNEQQKRDFELIKRQYKNITDIMTYDDLLKRMENIIMSLKTREDKVE
ncbi:MAG: DUF4263 domain-containing protein, partial [Lachnospiraceae bacterium]|nr:DUF4263 domain-containing protein [Lachnospiraceae bacterium]